MLLLHSEFTMGVVITAVDIQVSELDWVGVAYVRECWNWRPGLNKHQRSLSLLGRLPWWVLVLPYSDKGFSGLCTVWVHPGGLGEVHCSGGGVSWSINCLSEMRMHSLWWHVLKRGRLQGCSPSSATTLWAYTERLVQDECWSTRNDRSSGPCQLTLTCVE